MTCAYIICMKARTIFMNYIEQTNIIIHELENINVFSTEYVYICMIYPKGYQNPIVFIEIIISIVFTCMLNALLINMVSFDEKLIEIILLLT